MSCAHCVGLCGGSASGKTTVARKITEALDLPWVSLVSMDSFYKVGFKVPHTKSHYFMLLLSEIQLFVVVSVQGHIVNTSQFSSQIL